MRDFGRVLAGQVLLSGLSFFLSLAFVYGSSKHEYATYSLVSAALLLSLTVQNAGILTPLTVNGARLEGTDRHVLAARLARTCLRGSVILAIAGGVAAWYFFPHEGGGRLPLALATGVAVLGGWSREFRRSEQLLEGQYARLMTGDLLLVLLAAGALIAALVVGQGLPAWLGLGAVGIAGIATGYRKRSVREWVAGGNASISPPVPIGEQVRWTLPSVVLSWLQASAYPYIVAIVVGTSSVADVAAARILVVPGLLVGTAWQRLYLPKFGVLVAREGPRALAHSAVVQLRRIMFAAAIYSVMVLALLQTSFHQIAPAAYRNIGPIVTVWLVFLVLTSCRGVASAALQALAEFRVLFFVTLVASLASLVAAISIGSLVGAVGTIWGVVAGEVVLSAALWWKLKEITASHKVTW